jgi:energy-converting hydrogenase Eha subunit A
MGGVSDPSATSDRPPQVTVAVGIAALGSIFVVLAAWDRITGLHSLDTRASLSSVLDAPVLRDNEITVSQLIVAVKIVSMVAAACATAIAVLSVQTLRRNRPARLAMTVLAVPTFFGGLAADGIFSSTVAAAVATLWFGPARLWFLDGAATPDRPPARTRPPASPGDWPPPSTPAYDVRRGVAGRPNALLTACLLTWMFCSMTVLLVGASLVVLAIDSTAVLDRMHRQDPQLSARGVTDHQLLVFAYVTGGVLIAWSVAAAALAALAFNRRRWAWTGLLVSTTAVVVLGLVAVLGFVLVLVPLTAAVVTVVLLTRRDVRHWVRP